jgi:hypothetical protein
MIRSFVTDIDMPHRFFDIVHGSLFRTMDYF